MATTPPPQNSVHPPSTPLHGAKFDTYQHSRTRKSTRPTTRRSQRAAHTPPAASIASTSSARILANTYSPPSSADTSPQTRATKRRRGNPYSDTDTGKGDSSPTTDINMDPLITSDALPVPGQGTFNAGSNMLPTPAKTPRKKDLRKTSELQSAARVLFPSRLEKAEDAMPSKQVRRGRKNVGFSLDDSGEDEDANGRIQIFTDSKEKIPELDLGDHNPFLDNPDTAGAPESHKTTRRSGRKSKGHVKTNPHIQDAFNHEEGMVYVFRGKKIFRRFSPDPDHPNLSSEETEIEGSISPRLRPLTRASVKPRLLFPTEKQRHEREFREEALTNVEDGHIEKADEKMVTPVKQSFGPATPPTTGHATRSATRRMAAKGGSSPLGPPDSGTMTPAESKPRKKTSPFDDWQRTKAGPAGHRKGKKRSAEHMEKDGVGAGNKKTKVNAGASGSSLDVVND
ncbi:MAG: hypothetical protein Q9201_000868 [Fulgogasparrea decipioides]